MQFPANPTIEEAVRLQNELRQSVQLVSYGRQPRTIAGVDVSMNRFSNVLYAGWIVFSYPELIEIDHGLARVEASFPYVPGFLSFREIPALLRAWERLSTKPDVTMVDGQGIAHPRRLGIAAHLGLVLDIAAFGCAKSRLYGIGEEPSVATGSISYLLDPKDGTVIGAYLRTKHSVKPVLVSAGNRVTLEESLKITRSCVRGYRIPEPTRRAHELVNAYRRGEIS
jgi:deoxyribonuclease V